MRRELLATRIARHAVVGSRTDGVRVLQQSAGADEDDVGRLARGELARTAYQVDAVREHHGVNALGEAFERLVDVLRRVDLEVRHRQQLCKPIPRQPRLDHEQRHRTRRLAQHDTGHRRGIPLLLQRLVQNPAPRKQMLSRAGAGVGAGTQRGSIARSAVARGCPFQRTADGLCQVFTIALGDIAGRSVLERLASALVTEGSRDEHERDFRGLGGRNRECRDAIEARQRAIGDDQIRPRQQRITEGILRLHTRPGALNAGRPQLAHRQLGIGNVVFDDQ